MRCLNDEPGYQLEVGSLGRLLGQLRQHAAARTAALAGECLAQAGILKNIASNGRFLGNSD
jgi:hypothetical protein